jgi:hypothetical protein
MVLSHLDTGPLHIEQRGGQMGGTGGIEGRGQKIQVEIGVKLDFVHKLFQVARAFQAPI